MVFSYTGGLRPGAKCKAKPKVLLWLSGTAVAAERWRVGALVPQGSGPAVWASKGGPSTRAAQQQRVTAGVTHLPLSLACLLGREGVREKKIPAAHSGYSSQDAPLKS